MAIQQDREHTEVMRATGRPVVRGAQGLVASGHCLTSMAGMRMLLSGGNAFDAAVACGFAAAVIEPTASYSLATEGVGMLYHAASGTIQALSGQGVAPQAATVEAFQARGLQKIPTGPGKQAHLSFTVPGWSMRISDSWKPMAPKPWRKYWNPRSTTPSMAFPCTSTCTAS